MGNKGNPDGTPATWHAKLYETSQLPANMAVLPVALLCVSSGVLLTVVGLGVSVLATLAANTTPFVLSPFNQPKPILDFFGPHLQNFFLNPVVLTGFALRAILVSGLFSATYIVLRRMKKTGWIAFALAGFIMGPLVVLLTSILSIFVNYGLIPTQASINQTIVAVILAALIYPLTAIIFRQLLGRYGPATKNRNVSAPASDRSSSDAPN